jgi:hypothetical protein
LAKFCHRTQILFSIVFIASIAAHSACTRMRLLRLLSLGVSAPSLYPSGLSSSFFSLTLAPPSHNDQIDTMVNI